MTTKSERCPTARQRIYDWMDQPSHVVRARAVELGLFEEGDDQVRGDEIHLLWIRRAKAKNLVDALLNDGHTSEPSAQGEPAAPAPTERSAFVTTPALSAAMWELNWKLALQSCKRRGDALSIFISQWHAFHSNQHPEKAFVSADKCDDYLCSQGIAALNDDDPLTQRIEDHDERDDLESLDAGESSTASGPTSANTAPENVCESCHCAIVQIKGVWVHEANDQRKCNVGLNFLAYPHEHFAAGQTVEKQAEQKFVDAVKHLHPQWAAVRNRPCEADAPSEGNAIISQAPQPLSTQDETAEQFWGTFFGTGREYADKQMCEFAEAYASSRLSAAIDPLRARLEAAEQGLATKVKVLEHALAAVQAKLARYEALDQHLPPGFAIGDDATADLAIKLVETEAKLAAAQKENLELLRQLGIQIKAWEGQSDLREEAETKLAAAEKELDSIKQVLALVSGDHSLCDACKELVRAALGKRRRGRR